MPGRIDRYSGFTSCYEFSWTILIPKTCKLCLKWARQAHTTQQRVTAALFSLAVAWYLLCSVLVGQRNENCGGCLLFSSSERIKKRQTLILIQNGPSLLSFCLLLKELFLGTVTNSSGDFKLPPEVCITYLEELSIIWDYCGEKSSSRYPFIVKKLCGKVVQLYFVNVQ